MDLTPKRRAKMPKKEFALPKSRGFPLNDKKHQRLAIPMAERSERAGNISHAIAERIESEARAKLAGHGHKKTTPKGYTGSY